MCTEIEAKLKVDYLEEITHRLAKLNAEFLAEQLQTDYYFDDADTALTKTDRCLRLRRQLIGPNEKISLTYTGPKQEDNYKKRHENELEIKDFDSTVKLLSALGYEKALVFEKKRRLWRLQDCTIALDQLPLLGDFVEIEGPDDKIITDVQKSLELADLSHIKQSYAHLMAEELNRLGKNQREVFL